jgi:signal peptidase
MVIASGSMEPSFRAGDLVVVRGIPFEEIHIGDVIVFRSPRPGDERVYVHRVVGFVSKAGETYIRTKGDDVSVSDSWLTSEEDYIGRILARVPWIGRLRLAAGPNVLNVITVIVLLNLAYFVLTRYGPAASSEAA